MFLVIFGILHIHHVLPATQLSSPLLLSAYLITIYSLMLCIFHTLPFSFQKIKLQEEIILRESNFKADVPLSDLNGWRLQ